jgi:hypothetical protein
LLFAVASEQRVKTGLQNAESIVNLSIAGEGRVLHGSLGPPGQYDFLRHLRRDEFVHGLELARNFGDNLRRLTALLSQVVLKRLVGILEPFDFAESLFEFGIQICILAFQLLGFFTKLDAVLFVELEHFIGAGLILDCRVQLREPK